MTTTTSNKVNSLLPILIILCLIPTCLPQEQYLPVQTSQQTQHHGGSINHLKFSPGGAYFYKKYVITHKPLVIKKAAENWPLISKWKDQESRTSLIQDFKYTSEEIFEKQHHVNIMLSEHKDFLENIHLPLILQCQEFGDKLIDVRLQVNAPTQKNFEISKEDQLIIPIDVPYVALIIDDKESDILSESSKKDQKPDINGLEEAEKILQTRKILHQRVELEVGDLLYIPKYTWHYIAPSTNTPGATSITILFDYFPSIPPPNTQQNNDVTQHYNDFLSLQEKTIHCNNTRSSFSHSLNKTINFDDELGTSHLRIPTKNKRPEDVVLASGHTMPVLGLGTALLNEKTYDAVKVAFDEGYRLFDLAHGYPLSEESFGRAFNEQTTIKREDIFVVTKLQPRYLGYKETLEAVDDSLRKLNLAYIDLYLIHSKTCDDFLLKCGEGEPKGTWKDSWRAMEHAVREGKIRSIGVSNFYSKDIYDLLVWSEEPVSVIQNWFDPFNVDKETRRICNENNIRFMGYSTLGNYWKMLGTDFNPVMTSSTLLGIAGSYDYVIASVVLRWAIHENVTVIPRSANPKHIGQNIRALDLSLLPEEIDAINKFDDWMGDLMEKETVEDISKWTKDAKAGE